MFGTLATIAATGIFGVVFLPRKSNGSAYTVAYSVAMTLICTGIIYKISLS